MLSRRQLMNDKMVSAQGENLSLANVKGSKLNALSVYGKSTQDGTPSPENPVPIVSAGDDGEINVSVSDGGTQSQTLTLSTPGGLPGIPVDSGGNYTDESGQQWICDEIDFKRGKLIKRVGKTVVDGADIKFEADGAGAFWNLPMYSSPGIKYDASIWSTYFPLTVFNENKPYEFIWTSTNLISSYFSTVNELNQFCTEMNDMGQPVTLYYTLDTPIETDLTAEEIAAYKALHTYTPNTSVGNDADAGVKIGYREYKN